MNNKFKPMELGICDLQYKITHHSILDFKLEDILFLKSNSEWPLLYIGIYGRLIIVRTPEGEYEKFPPECLLQYKYRALIVYKKVWDICLN
jgi:hypothetical protein